MASIRQLYVNLSLRADNFNNQLRSAQREMKEFERIIKPSTRALNDIGRTATAAGGAMTAGLTVPLTAVAALSVKAATDFESSFAGVRKTVDATESEFAELSQGFREMAKTVPTSVNALNKVGEAAGQLGIPKESILEFTRVMADLGVTTNLTADQAATATANIQNIFGAAGKDVDRFGATLVALGNAGASTESEIIDMGARIAGAGHLMNMTQAEVLAFASALSSVGIRADAGGSSISRVMLKMNDFVQAGGADLQELGRVAGMTGDQFKTAFEANAASAMVSFIQGLARLKGEGENVSGVIVDLFGKQIILRDTLLRAAGAGSLLNDQLALGRQAWIDNNALVKEAQQRYATFESQILIFKNRLTDIAITIGQALLPILLQLLNILSPVIDIIAKAAEWFSKLPVPVQTVAIAIAAVVAAIGPLLLAFGLAATSIAALIPAITGLVAFLGTVGGPILLIVAAIGVWVAALASAGVALVAFIASNEEMRNAVGEAWAQIKVAALDLWASVSEIFGDLAADIKVLWGQVGPDVLFVFTNMVKVAAEMLKNLASIVSTGLKVISGAVQVFHGLVTADASKFSAGIQKIWKALWDAIKGLVGTYLNSLKLSITAFTEKVSNAFKAMYDAVVGNSYVPDMIEGIRAEFGRLPAVMVIPTKQSTDSVRATFADMFSSISSLAKAGFAGLKSFYQDFSRSTSQAWRNGMDDLVGQFARGWSRMIVDGQGFSIKIKDIFKDMAASIIENVVKNALGKVSDALTGVLGKIPVLGSIFGGGQPPGGITGRTVGGIFGGGGAGGAAGTAASTGMSTALGFASIGASLVGPIGQALGKIGAGRDSANEIVKSQNAFEATLHAIITDPILSATNKLKQVSNVWEGFQANLERFSAAGGEGGVTANQAFATLLPRVSKIESELLAAGASTGSTGNVGGNVVNNFGDINLYMNLENVHSPQEFGRWLDMNAADIRTKIIRAVDLADGGGGAGLVTSH